MKLMLLATGGTIACTPTENGLAPTLHAQDLLDILGASLPCEVEARDVFQMDSSNMQPEEWSILARAIDDALKACDGVVSIPIYGEVNSFNVSAATAIILAEVARQHHKN